METFPASTIKIMFLGKNKVPFCLLAFGSLKMQLKSNLIQPCNEKSVSVQRYDLK